MRIRINLPIFCIFFCGTLLILCSSWGFLVHRTVNQLAIYKLPRPMQTFFFRNKGYLVKESTRPDLRRNTDPRENPRHFIDLEGYGDSAAWKMPLSETAAIAKYSRDTLEKYGFVPYEIVRVKHLLTGAFRNGNKDSILFYAADLGHYIADANVPLHSSINHDGQLTGQKGIHSLWESAVPDLDMDHYKLYDGIRAHYLADPSAAIWDAIRHANSLVDDLLAQEKQATLDLGDSAKYRMEVRNGKESRSYSPAFVKAYSARLGTTVNDQLLRAASLIADFWYTAWVDAGRPDLSALVNPPAERADKRAFRNEYKNYRHEQLISRGLLISKQQSAAAGAN